MYFEMIQSISVIIILAILIHGYLYLHKSHNNYISLFTGKLISLEIRILFIELQLGNVDYSYINDFIKNSPLTKEGIDAHIKVLDQIAEHYQIPKTEI